MAAPHSFEDTEVWKAARELTRQVYTLCRREPLARDLVLCEELRRASIFVMNHLAEGWENTDFPEKRQAYSSARRACGEVRSMTYVLLDNQLLLSAEHAELLKQCTVTGNHITGLLLSLERRSR